MRIVLFILSLGFFTNLNSQSLSIKGGVEDESGLPIDAVTCTLTRASDSLQIQTVLSEEDGSFLFNNLQANDYHLYLQHLSYKQYEKVLNISGESIVLEPIILLASENRLADVVVKGERPVVKAEDGKLVYNAQRLSEGKVISNAYETLSNIPGIMNVGDKLELIGASSYAILMNGQLTTLSMDQLVSLLKSTPASRVKNVEIMYSAPPKYNIRGAAINVVLTDQTTDTPVLQGEAKVEYRQKHYAGFNTRANILYTQPSYSVDFTLNVNKFKGWTNEKMYALHQFKGNEYDISQYNRGKSEGYDYEARLGFNYNLMNKDKIQLVYNGNLENVDSERSSNSIFLENQNPFRSILSENNVAGDSYLHNVKAVYSSHKNIEAGVDYTNYKDPTTQIYKESGDDVIIDPFKTETSQKIDKILVYANQTVSAGKGWKLDYGANYTFSKSKNDYNYFKNIESSIADSVSKTNQQEHNASIFAGFNKSFNDKLSLQASLSVNYFKSDINIMGEKKNLWEDFQPFLNANLTYTFNPKRVLQLSFSSDVTYPTYWALNPNVWQINAYSVSKGNPELKFSKTYEAQAVFIMNQKYIIMGFFKYTPDYSTQLPYQSGEELQTIFQTTNLDYMRTYGMAFIVPFKVGNVLDTKATLNIFRIEEEDTDFYDIPYKRSKNTMRLQVSNTVNISSKPNLKMDISGFYMPQMLQGVYDLGNMSDVSAGLKWTFLKNNAELMFQVNDIFKGNSPHVKVNYANQRSSMKVNTDTRVFRLSFIYRFGNYKKKTIKGVDMFRFNRGG